MMHLFSIFTPGCEESKAAWLQQKLTRDGNNFNFLRLFLAAMVVLSHSYLLTGNDASDPLSRVFGTLSLGSAAVDGFFLISGFLIVRSWMQTPQFWPYLRKRALRIYPGFLVAFAFCVLLLGPLGSSAPNYFGDLDVRKLVLYALKLQEPSGIPVFEGQVHPTLNLSMWTIAYEFRCYLLVLILGGLGAFKNRVFWGSATILLIALYLHNHSSPSFGFPHSFFLLGRPAAFMRLITIFMIGGCFYLFANRIRFTAATALLCAPLLFAALFSSKFAELTLAILGGYLLFWFAFLNIPQLERFKRAPDISYGLYLYGWPVQKLVLLAYPLVEPLPLFALALPLAGIFGYVSWHTIEKPALQWKRRFAIREELSA